MAPVWLIIGISAVALTSVTVLFGMTFNSKDVNDKSDNDDYKEYDKENE